MNHNFLLGCCIFFLSVFVSSVSQIILKKSANKSYSNAINEYLNPLVIFAYILFFGATLLTTFAYRFLPLSLGTIFESAGYIYIAIGGYLFLKEKISLRQLLGNALIIIGIIIFAV